MLISEQQETIMVFNGVIAPEKRAYIAFSARDKDIPTQDIVEKCNVSKSSVYRIFRKTPFKEKKVHKRNTLDDIQVSWVFGNNDLSHEVYMH